MKSRSNSGKSRLRVGGSSPVRSDCTAMTASTTPDAPSRCPVDDLVAVIGTAANRSPNTAASAFASAASPAGIEVPWALMWPTSSAVMPASAGPREPPVLLRGPRDAVRSGGVRHSMTRSPESTASVSAPRAAAASSDSSSTAAAPCDITKPDRLRSKGMLAASGCSS